MTASTPVVSQTMVLSDDDLAARAELEHSWKFPPGFVGWLKNTSHLSIGKRYIITALVFFILGGLEAGAKYVTENSYLIKADVEKSGASHDH